MSSLNRLKVDFFLGGGEFDAKAKKLARTLLDLGEVVLSDCQGGIAQFVLKTDLSSEQVDIELQKLSLGGSLRVNREERAHGRAEMSPA